MKDHPERFLATVLLGNNLVNIAISALATSLAISSLGSDREGLSIVLATALVTVGIVIFGEAVPKAVASRIPERLAFLFVRPLEVVETVLLPFASVLHAISTLVTRPLVRKTGQVPLVSEEELRMLVTLGVREGTVEAAQAEIIGKAFRLKGLRAQEIMTPRTEIVWVEKNMMLKDFLKFYAQETHNRFPVYEGDPDNVAGFLYVKDVLKAFAEGTLKEQDSIAPQVRPAYLYPETKPVDDLLAEMRTQGIQMVLLVDEFGGISGLLTLKQIAGEIVGRITEDEGGKPRVKAIDDRTIQVDATMRVEEANQRLGLSIPQGEYETLAGFMLYSLGRIPREGEQVQHDGTRLVVSEMRGVKIERLLVTRP